MDIFELLNKNPEVVVEWIEKNSDKIQAMIRNCDRHMAHKFGLVTRSMYINLYQVLPSELKKSALEAIKWLNELENADEILTFIAAGIKKERSKYTKSRVVYAQENNSLELMQYLIIKYDQHILNPEKSVVIDPKRAPEFLEMLHRSFSHTQDRSETALNISVLCERFVDPEKWKKLKNNFTSWNYNQSHDVKGLSLSGKALKALKDVHKECGFPAMSNTVVYLCEMHEKQKKNSN